MDWMAEAKKENGTNAEIHSYNEYMDIFENNPQRECRPTNQYFLDMIEHFGKCNQGNYNLFQMEHTDSPAIYGQSKPEQELVQNLKNFQEEGFNNKLILLVGPNGSSKSSIIRKFMKGAEEYSKSSLGSLYTFSWVFPIDNYIKGSLGLGTKATETNVNSYAHLEDKDISAIVGSELKDHPLLLIPREYRQKIIDSHLKSNVELYESIKKSYLYIGDLSKRNKMIYDALLLSYKGSHEEVLKHIRVERFTISKRYSSSAVTIEPQLHVDAKIQQITMDKRLASLPPSLQSLNLFSLQGEAVLANRGVLEYSDLLKRPLDTYKYLLMTMETKNINLQGILTELDVCFVGTSNEVHLAAFKQHPDYNSFKGRINFIRVPYLLNHTDEEKIYKEQVNSLQDKTIFEPHSLKAICLFSVMTRLRSPMAKNYDNKKLSDLVASLNPLEKAKMLSSKDIPERYKSEDRQILEHNISQIANEFISENLYEGKFGISPRDIKNILYILSSKHKNITFIETIEFLEDLIQKKSEYDFLNMTPQGDFHHPARFIALIKDEMLQKFDKELRDSLGLVDARSYEDYLKKYIENINALIKEEKIKNSVTGKFELCDDFFIQEFESNIILKEDASTWRSHLISKLGAYFLDNPGKSIVYNEVFPDIVKRLKESFRVDQKEVILNISKNIVFYESEITETRETDNKDNKTPLTKENRELLERVVGNLMNKYGYSQMGALTVLKFIIKDKY